jgi:riboflavin kinase, archaea type
VPAEPAPEARSGRPKGGTLPLLKLLAAAGADRTPLVITSREVGEKLGVSQQAADRYLVDLERRGFLRRTLAQRRQRLELTAAAMSALRHEYQGYRRIFEGPARLALLGTVASGLGEGRYYLSQPGYQLQFRERLGYAPYPGTLNVRLEGAALRSAGVVAEWSGLRIDGFQASGRTFGGASCFRSRINGHSSHLIRPDRSHYQDVIEFIAPESLRETLHLKDGDQVRVEIEEP